ncbi:MAG: acyl-CoA thioesterase [Bacteroidia bacterium]|nr:acyl-CoA thioesterase [Bacteroidia bacterium]
MFNHKSKIEIRFSDIDAFHHVNNATYLTYYEQARIAYFNEIVGWEYDWSKTGVILAKAVVEFRVPVDFKDDIIIYTRCCRIGTKSFDLQYRMMKVSGEEEMLVSEASTIMVAYNYELNQSIEIPESWKELIRRFEVNQSL